MDKDKISDQFKVNGLSFVLSPWNLAGLYTNKDGSFTNPQSKLFEKKWSQLKKDVKTWYAERVAHKLGNILDSAVQSDVWVIHLLCQKEDLSFDLVALGTCLDKTVAKAKFEKATLHVSNLFTAQVPELVSLLDEHARKKGVTVYYYDEV